MSDPLRILLVEDDDADRAAIRRLLERSHREPVELVECTDAAGALEAARRTPPPDCVLLDLSLPDVDGLEFLDLLRREQREALPVVILTGNGNERIAVDAMKRGATDYLTKNDLDGALLARTVSYAVARAELQRRIADQQEELRQFAFTAAHDLRAPLNGIGVHTELLREALRGGSDDARVLLDRIAASVRTLSELIDSLVSFAEVGWERDALRPIELEEALRQALALLEPSLREAGARVEHDALPSARGHLPSLTRLFQNLVANAVKFRAGAPPRIRIRCEPLDDGHGLHLVVEDDGPGIPAAERGKVFDSFYRGRGAGQRSGSGLGLSICRRIVHRHGGRIWIDAAPGGGCAVHVVLRA